MWLGIYTTTVKAFLPRNIMAIVLPENIQSFYTVEAAKSAQCGEGAQALYHDKRLKDETDLSGISWALGTQWQQLFQAFCPSALGYAYKWKTHAKHLWVYTKTQTYICPKSLLWYHTHTHMHTHAKQFCLHFCKQVSPVWHHSKTAGYGSKKRQQITVDYINTEAWLSPQYQYYFTFRGITITLCPITLTECTRPNSAKLGLKEKLQFSMLVRHEIDQVWI